MHNSIGLVYLALQHVALIVYKLYIKTIGAHPLACSDDWIVSIDLTVSLYRSYRNRIDIRNDIRSDNHTYNRIYIHNGHRHRLH